MVAKIHTIKFSLFLVVGLVVQWLYSGEIRGINSMERLPDFLVLDFCEWLKQSIICKTEYDDIDIWDLLFDDRYEDILTKKAEEYCNRRCDKNLYYWRHLSPGALTYYLKVCYQDSLQENQKDGWFLHLEIEKRPIEIDFLEWLEEENARKDTIEKVDLMPVDVFEEYAHRFCEDTGSGVEIERKLVKRFKRSEPGSMLSKLNWLLPYGSAYRKKGFRYVSQRYLADSDTYKCLLLPIELDYPMFRRLVTKHWKDLNDLSADYLDIYYCFENYGKSGYDLMEQLHYLPEKVHAKLPCIVLWKENMDEALCVSIDGLSVEDVYYLIREIVDLIIQRKTLDEIIEGAKDMSNERRNKERPITDYNLSADGATGVNQAVVTGGGNIVSQRTSQNENDDFIKELNQAIDTVVKSELPEEQKKILIDIFEDAKKKDKQEEAKARFSTFIAFAGKTAAKLIDVFAGLATIATFFGLNQVH